MAIGIVAHDGRPVRRASERERGAGTPRPRWATPRATTRAMATAPTADAVRTSPRLLPPAGGGSACWIGVQVIRSTFTRMRRAQTTRTGRGRLLREADG